MVSPQTPKEDFGGYVGVKVGNYGLRTVNGAINIPIVKDRVLLRGAFETARRDGFTRNLATGQRHDNLAYEGFRGSLTLRPTDTIEHTTILSYHNTHDNGTAVNFGGITDAAPAATLAAPPVLFAGRYATAPNATLPPKPT